MVGGRAFRDIFPERREDIDVLGGLFICYRREDAAGFAWLIYDRLTAKLGRDSVFFDVDNIPVGLDFVDILSERVGKCEALIAVIGRSWASSVDVHNRRRLDDPDDFVRIEIEATLERKIRVIPVLVEADSTPTSSASAARLPSWTRSCVSARPQYGPRARNGKSGRRPSNGEKFTNASERGSQFESQPTRFPGREKPSQLRSVSEA